MPSAGNAIAEMGGDGASSPLPYPDHVGERRAWSMVALLCLLMVFSFVDRMILGLVAVDMGRDLEISDTQVGLLIGTSFAIVYALSGIPIAHLLDTRNRKRIICGGVLLWSLCTIASAFAPSFAMLASCRIGLALGEAVLTPAAISLIGDSFPRERRVAPTAAYGSVSAVMGVGGLLIGAVALQLAGSVADDLGMSPWRLTLVFVGVPPLLLALVFAGVVREPERGRFDADGPGAGKADMAGFAMFLRHHAGFYASFYAASALVAIFLFGIMTWSPTLLIRGYGWTPAAAGYAFGTLGVAVGLVSAVLWPRIVIACHRRGVADALPLVLGAGLALLAPFMIVGPSLPTATLLLVAMAGALLAGGAVAVLTPLTIQHYAPSEYRARLMSLVMFSQSLIGYGIGPASIAWLATRWPGQRLAMGYSLSAVAAASIPLAVILYLLARRSARTSAPRDAGS